METTRRSLSSIFLLFLTVSCVLDPTRFADASGQQPIKRIVVLVLENRSFDHMIGWMKKSINPSINGVTGKECNPFSTNLTRTPNQVTQDESICFTDDAKYVDPDPGHSFEDVEKQVFGSNPIPSMTGFVEQALSVSPNLSETVMKGFKPENVPIFAKLVQEFAVFDRWFSSIPGPTQPNRLFVYSATSHGSTSHVKKQLAKGYPQKTIFDSLHENKKDWGVYFQNIPTTLFYRNMRKLKYVFKFHQYGTFKQHAKDGKLPNLSVIEPRYFDIKGFPANDDHPSHDVANGQNLVKEVYETLRASPQWNESLLVITYDEHGGFFDHVKTPYKDVPSPDGNTGPAPSFFKFDRLGVRVPTIMVSPWIKKGTEVLPEAAPLRETEPDEARGLSQFQSEVVQLAAVLNGDHFLSSFPDEMGKKMSVKEAHTYVKGAVSRFITASKEAINLGADESAIVDMRSSLTTRTVIHN
ncbi:Phosphoesterase [Cynara cardunculus var. scolymus]|uniref:Phosphoesterase n=1 Tax=Cynara cardunculus var. scolymus TaxID=59895 RepID=A0A103YBT5_CYNCS|nr:Phosphoesterase [Cynara cardunculus var. scolymus]